MKKGKGKGYKPEVLIYVAFFVCRKTIWSVVTRLGDKYSNVTEWFHAVLYNQCLVPSGGHVCYQVPVS